jgi:hypothetical protein
MLAALAVLATGMVAAAIEPTAPRVGVISVGPAAPVPSSTEGRSAPGSTTTTSAAAAGSSAIVAPGETTPTARAKRPAATATTLAAQGTSSTTLPGSVDVVPNWQPGDPYPASWAALDARAGKPPYPYVVPEVCRGGPNPWDDKAASSTTVSVAGGGTITITIDPCVIFARETFSYHVSITGPVDIWISRPDDPNSGEVVSPRLSCPQNAMLTEQPVDLSRTWTSERATTLHYWPPQGDGVTPVTIPVSWTTYGSVPSHVSPQVYHCTQTGRGVANVTVPVVIEHTERPQEMGGTTRGPGLMSTG